MKPMLSCKRLMLFAFHIYVVERVSLAHSLDIRFDNVSRHCMEEYCVIRNADSISTGTHVAVMIP